MATQQLDPKILPVLKTAAPDPTLFLEPTVFKEGSSSSSNDALYYVKIALILILIILLGLNIYFYMTEGVTLYTKIFGDGSEEEEEEKEDPIEHALEEKKEKDEYKPDPIEKL